MKRLALSKFVLFGLAFWGIPAVAILGLQAIFLTALAALPLFLFENKNFRTLKQPALLRFDASILSATILVYLLLDAIWGRKKLSANLFFDQYATNAFVDSANAMISQGRGLVDLLGAMMIIAPFVLIDLRIKMGKAQSIFAIFVAITFIIYDVGIGRAYLFMAALAISFGLARDFRFRLLGAAFAVLVFVIASVARGAVGQFDALTPIIDGLVWPFRNLDSLVISRCGNASTFDFMGELFKKFIPNFIMEKTIFSFNIEMTNCIYPLSTFKLESISIFTWLGEIVYYKPSFLTAVLAGGVLAVFVVFVERLLLTLNLETTRYFIGFFSVALLRSRVLDVMTFLILCSIFLTLLYVWVNRNSKHASIVER